MTMIPPKIKKLPNLHKPLGGYIKQPSQSSAFSNQSLYAGGAKLVK